jgi:mRNA interferase RelE/StbE
VSKPKRRKGKAAPPQPGSQPKTYTVEFDRRHALEPISAIADPVFRARVFAAVRALATNPRPPGCKKLSGTRRTFWRVRVGDWRLVYVIEDFRLYVLVVRAGDRKEIDRLLSDLLK